MNSNPKTNWVTMVTPFKEDNSIDYPSVKQIVEWYIANKVDGIFAVCQSSEMFFLSLKEREALARFVIDAAGGRIPVVVSGHVSENIDDQIEELKIMAALKPEVLVLVSNRLCRKNESEAAWKENTSKILKAIPNIDFGIYECPYPYKRLLSPALLKWCVDTGRFAFLKDTCCDLKQLEAKIQVVADSRLKIYNANSATLLDSLRLGLHGFCGVMLNFHPLLYHYICKYWQSDPALAEKLQHFATTASLIELQMYPVNAKYHLGLEGVDISTYARSNEYYNFSVLNQLETEHLHQMWKDFSLMLEL